MILFIISSLEIFKTHIGPLLLAFLISYSFHITFPVILDRSISVHILNFINTQSSDNSSISITEIKNDFTTKYIRGNGAICRRIYEQNKTGNIKIDNNNQIHITKLGKKTASFFSLLTKIYKVNNHDILDDNACDKVFNN